MKNNDKKIPISKNRAGDRSIISIIMKDYDVKNVHLSIDTLAKDELDDKKFNNFSKDLCKLLDQYKYKYDKPIKDGNNIIITLRDKEEEKYND